MKKPVRSIALGLVLSITVAILSVNVERIGPEQIEYGNLCGPSSSDACYKPAFKGGFPVAFLIDAPGVSVEYQLAFVEDNFYPWAFVLDVAAYLAVYLLVLARVARRYSRHEGRV
jgi:hypothetical protein